jgi:DNA polymerase-3 subunit delta
VSALTPDALRAAIAAGRIEPLYLIEGTDELLKSELAALFSEAIEPELRAFNVERLYGMDQGFDPMSIVEAVRTLPMMAPRRVVVVLQAERVLNPKGEAESGDEALGPLAECIEHPIESTTLVFVIQTKLDGTRRLTKLLRRHAVSVACGEVGRSAALERQIESRARELGLDIEPRAVRRLIELAAVPHAKGEPDTVDIAKLRADTERVLAFAGQGTVTAAHVDQVVDIVERSADDWLLVRAIERGDVRVALRELRVRLDAGDNVFKIVGQIAGGIRSPRSRIPDHRLRPAIDALWRIDTDLKSSGGDPRMLLERLIVELCGG